MWQLCDGERAALHIIVKPRAGVLLKDYTFNSIVFDTYNTHESYGQINMDPSPH